MGTSRSKPIGDIIKELNTEYEHTPLNKINGIKKNIHTPTTSSKKNSCNTTSFTVGVNKINNIKHHNFIKFKKSTHVTIDAIKHYTNIGILKERIFNITIDACKYIKIYDPFNENAFENPIQVGEIVYYGIKADVGYLVSFIDTNYESYIELSH